MNTGRHNPRHFERQITFRLDADSYAKLMELAKQNDVSLAEQARRMCIEQLALTTR